MLIESLSIKGFHRFNLFNYVNRIFELLVIGFFAKSLLALQQLVL